MVTLVFAVAAVVCGLGWLNATVYAKAILMWVLAKGLDPFGDEIEEYLDYAWKRTLGIK